jgi:hypothetical protein
MDERSGAPTSAEADDWQGKVVDTIEGVVGSVHDTVVRPLTIVARGLVFGIIIAVMGLVLAVLAFAALVRLLDVYAFRGRVWATDAVIGAVLVALGAFAWSRRTSRATDEP